MGAGVAHQAAADGHAGHDLPYGRAFDNDSSSAGRHGMPHGIGCGASHGSQPTVRVYANACYAAPDSEASADSPHLHHDSSSGSAGSGAECAHGWGAARAAAHPAAAGGAGAGGCCGGDGLTPVDECAAAFAAAEFVLS